MSSKEPLIPENFEFAKHLHKAIQFHLFACTVLDSLPIHVHVIFYTRRGRVNPLLGFDFAGAVVEFVCYVCALCGDVADLADAEDGSNVCAVDLEGGFGVCLGCVEDLFDGYWSEGWVFALLYTVEYRQKISCDCMFFKEDESVPFHRQDCSSHQA